MRKLLITLMLFAGLAYGQQLGRVFSGSGAPTGGCNVARFYVDTAGSTLYYCANGVWTAAASSGSVAWSSVTGTPTTLAGYGITDALPIAGGTMTGTIQAVAPTTGQESLILPFGVSPTTPTNGSLWCRTADNFCYIRANGVSQAIAWQSSLSSMPGVGMLAQTDTSSPPTLVNRTVTGTASYIGVSNGDGASGNPTITIAAGPVRTRVCEVYVYGSGASGVLQDTDDVINTCTNVSGVAQTITAYGCQVDSTTGTPQATPVLGDGSTAVTTAGVNCTATANALTMGTISGTPTLNSINTGTGACTGNCTINAILTTAGGTAKWIKHVFVMTY